MTITHCNFSSPANSSPPLPSWAIPVPAVNTGTVTVAGDPGSGKRHGIVIFLHPNSSIDQPIPLSVPNGIGENIGAFASSVAANGTNGSGWLTLYPAIPSDFSVQGLGPDNATAMSNVVKNDAGNGTFMTQTMATWWDHIVKFIVAQYGSGRPIVIGGFSFGAWTTMQIVVARTSSVVGYFVHAVPTIWESLQLGLPPGSSANPFASLNCTGIDLTSTWLSTMTIPGIYGWNTSDGTVGWNGSSTPPSNTATIIANASNLTSYQSTTDQGTAYPDGHLFLPGDGATYSNWIASNFNTIYPASF